MRETFASVIAANRFGLGARPGELALIGSDARELTRTGTEPEAVGGDDRSKGLAHAAVSRLTCP